MDKNNAIQKSLKKMLSRYKMFSKELRYQKVAEDLGVTPRWIRYIESGKKQASKPLQQLIKILAQ